MTLTMTKPFYETEIEVTRALANGTYSQHGTNCMADYKLAKEWQRWLKSQMPHPYRKAGKPANGTCKNFRFIFS
jgi:hypothetical protein